jgi:hypothetical protein
VALLFDFANPNKKKRIIIVQNIKTKINIFQNKKKNEKKIKHSKEYLYNIVV